jgi:peptide/nickel transport system substrate-binding protein
MRRTRSTMAVATLATVLATAACSGTGGSGNQDPSSTGFAACDTKPNTCNTAPTKPGGILTISIEKTIQNWNTFDSDGSQFETAQVMSGVTPTPFMIEPDTTVGWNPDLLVAEPKVSSTSPLTIVYRIRPEAVWSDGTPISAKDFAYFWHSNNGRDCPACTPTQISGYDAISAVTGSDNDKTVTVTFAKPYPDWQSLFAGLYPAHVAAKAGDLSTPAGLKAAFEAFKAVPTWSGAAYLVQDYQKDVSVTLVPNPRWYGTPKPSLEKIIFRIIADQAQQLPALRNREVQGLISQPDADMVAGVKALPGINYNLAKGLNWEHVDLNTTNRWLRDIPLRQAIFTAIDRRSIIAKTVGAFFPGAAPLGSHNFVPGEPGYKDFVTPTGQGSGNVDKAKQILTSAGYRIEGGKLLNRDGEPVPTLRFRFTSGNILRLQSGELIQAQLKQIGLDVKLDPTSTLSATLNNGDFDLIIFAWVTSPFLADKQDLWGTGGGGNYGKWSNKQSDDLIAQAVQTLDKDKARDLFNQADEIMTKEAYNLPLFQKPVFIAISSDFANVRNNSTSAGPAYNMDEWGLKA